MTTTQTDSSQSLLVILKQLLNPISPFAISKSVHRNTSIDFTPKSAAFGPMIHALAPFRHSMPRWYINR